MPKVALLVIDIQVGLLQDERYPIFNATAMVGRVAGLIARAREACVPVNLVQHCGDRGSSLEQGTSGWAIAPALGQLPGDTVVQKHTPDSFHCTELQCVLERQQTYGLVVCGIQSDYCVDTTVRRAYSLGYETILVEDCHCTCDSAGLSASQIVAHENEVLGNWFAKLQTACEVDFDSFSSTATK